MNLFVTLFISLSQATMWHKYVKISAILIIITLIVSQGIIHFFKPNYDYEMTLFLGKTISLRALIVSKSFDLGIWFLYQLFLVCKHPRKLYMTSKIEWYDGEAGAKSCNNLTFNINNNEKGSNTPNIIKNKECVPGDCSPASPSV